MLNRNISDLQPNPYARAGPDTVYDVDLLKMLNEEYACRPVHPNPPLRTDEAYATVAKGRLRHFPAWVSISGKRVLEIGCGSGHFGEVVAREASSYVGVDIESHSKWAELAGRYSNCEFHVIDLSQTAAFEPGSFDLIVSWVVWEHLRRPYAMLDAAQRLLRPGQYMILRANVHTSAIASHVYRDIYFPWPHLLFPENVLRDFLRMQNELRGRTSAAMRSEEAMPEPCLYVNRLVLANYLDYFRRTRWKVCRLSREERDLDREFLLRFEYVLGRYAEEDLALDFFTAVLQSPVRSSLGRRIWRRWRSNVRS